MYTSVLGDDEELIGGAAEPVEIKEEKEETPKDVKVLHK